METASLPHLPQHPLHICLFTDVQNASFLREQLLAGNTDYEYALLDASVLLSRSHVLSACFRAINDLIADRLKTKNVHSEIVFAMNPNNNVSNESDSTSSLASLRMTTIFRLFLTFRTHPYADRRVIPPFWNPR